jgi:hypothetical protein
LPFGRDERQKDDDFDPSRRNDNLEGPGELNRPAPHDDDRGLAPGRDVDRFKILDVSGRDGAVMRDVMEVVRDSIQEWVQRTEEAVDDEGADAAADGKLIVVVCAGENDVGSGTSTPETVEHWSWLLEAVEKELLMPQRSPPASSSSQLSVSVVLLGPKLEPWLASDPGSRKRYVRLPRALEARCRQHPNRGVRARFVDCLTLFCTPETASAPGALLGGRAMPDSTYFENDQLHLSEAGYRVWKKTVENALVALTNCPAD